MRLIRELRQHSIDVLLFLFWEIPNVNNIRGLKRPNKCLNPRYDCKESKPTHKVYRVCVGMPASDRDAARQSQYEYGNHEEGDDQKENNRKRQVIPEIERESHETTLDGAILRVPIR